MTLYEFKGELMEIRDNRRAIRSILRSLRELPDDRLGSVFSGAVDYSKDRIQNQAEPDAAIIDAIATLDRDTQQLLEKLRLLEETNERLEELIFKQKGIGGEVVRLYFIEGQAMIEIAKRLNYSRDWCYEKWNEAIKNMKEEFDDEHGRTDKGTLADLGDEGGA